jgi:hypothetical protein
VWAVGLAAYKLLRANRALADDRGDAIGVPEDVAQNWLTQFSISADQEVLLGGLLNNSHAQFDSFYTRGLIDLVEHCLLYQPRLRPTLEFMKGVIDTNIQ